MGIQSPQFDCKAPVTPASMALALKGFANPARVKNLTGLVELQLDSEVFHAFPQDGRLQVTGATSGHPDARIIASPGHLRPFLYGLAATSNNLGTTASRPKETAKPRSRSWQPWAADYHPQARYWRGSRPKSGRHLYG